MRIKTWLPFLILLEITVFLSLDMYLSAIKHLQLFFSADYYTIHQSINIFFLASVIMHLPVVWLSSCCSHRNLLVIYSLLFSCSCAICAYTTTYQLFLLCRFIQGSGICLVFIIGRNIIFNHYNNMIDTIKILSMISSISLISPSLGPIIGVYLTDIFGWQSIFLFLTTLSTISCYGLSKIENVSPKKFANSWIARIKIAINLKFLKLAIPAACIIAANVSWIVLTPTFIMETLKLDNNYYGYLMLYSFGCYIIGNITIAKIISNNNIVKILTISITFAILSIICSFFSEIIIEYTNLAIAFIGLFFCSSAILLSILPRLSMEFAETDDIAKLSIFQFTVSLTITIASLISGQVFDGSLISILKILLSLSTIALICVVPSYKQIQIHLHNLPTNSL